jgi:microcystin-dependent protein
MALLYNLARMTTATTGTGTITLGAAVSGFLSFANAGISDGDQVSYAIRDGGNSEIGTGTYTAAGTTLTRNVTKSTNSNNPLSLSGSAEVFITARKEDFLPIGTVLPYAGSAAPAGWLLCYGQNVSRTTYAALFRVLSTTFGAGDGSTTFGVPDLRGRFVAGLDNMGGSAANRLTNAETGGLDGSALGNTGGEQGHTITAAESAALSYTTTMTSSSIPARDSGSAGSGGVLRTNNSGTSDPITTSTFTLSTTDNAGGGAHNTVPPGIALNYMIFAGA